MAISISELYIYPVKSLKGISLNTRRCDIRGLEDDRRWMLIDEHNRFVTQRQWPALARLHTRLDQDALTLSAGAAEIRIARSEPDSPIEPATIWSDQVQVKAETQPVTAFIQDLLPDLPALRLVRLAAQRPQAKPQYQGENTHTVFADMAPLLVANSASLDALNRALIEKGLAPVPMNRFRPNVVISGIKAFAEHRLQGLQHNHYALKFSYPCERCVMTTVDQETGIKHPDMEPYRTLASINAMPAYGEGEHHKPANPKAPAFGENALLHAPANATLSVGDSLCAWKNT
ncbi:MOSC domain-containing protein [Simiduia agarivorans]|uniref:Molybdenum cofactor sulfurase n=1 Tax=Simiduia agarivorans (strain DSM 21679 / JCM 13881 / BCRC 17597 / SA1) TaxID=1117647 RepID=K4KNK6_SIMAS|nr:MOSC N-terminal beta barrel domain-containing protein [Simiduia agarivorans]AFV00745.1 molybdenum cofactor sulfurase [Simiduia agarivorans SA1 = DSM 21679]